MKKAICVVLTIVFLLVGIVMIPNSPSENAPSFPQKETLRESNISSESTNTNILPIKSGLPTDFVYIVYITETGKKYHSKKSCSGLSQAKAIYEEALDKASDSGLTPCSKCY